MRTATCRWVTKTEKDGTTRETCVTHGTDHGRLSVSLAVEAAKVQVGLIPEPPDYPVERWVSFACENPTVQQSDIYPSDSMARRHPYDGHRPRFSGWCMISDCSCNCHRNEPLEIEEIS